MKRVLKAFDRLSLSRKLASLLTMIFLTSLALVIGLMNIFLTDYTVKQIDDKSNFLIDSMSAVRQYTDKQIDPILNPINAISTTFMPESIPFYSAQQVFNYLQANPEYAEYSYREAVLNPTNPKDRADAREAQLIRTFRASPSLSILKGNRTTDKGMYHYVAKPIRVNDQKCLVCHSSHERAPASLVASYGKNNGFNWQFGEVIGAQIVSVPVDEIYKAKQNSLSWFGLLNAGAFFVTAGALLLFIGRAIVRPMKMISSRAFEASIHPENVEFSEKQRQDEIGLIAQSFDRMKQSLTIAMRMLRQSSGDAPKQ
jgi:HAMP domain-containing protein